MSDGPALQVELLTLFPEMFDSFLAASLLGKAITAGLVDVQRTNPRDFAPGKHRSVDDTPYGGGPGMVMRPEPMAASIDDIETRRGRAHRVFLSPSGTLFDQRHAADLARRGRVLLICGRYEGIDERVQAAYADAVVSVGDYVLCGGEAAAMVVIEAMARLVPGVVGCSESTMDESFVTAGRLEYPHYTRPPVFRGVPVPQVLLSGDHRAIERWRRCQALARTASRRPDLLVAHPPTAEEQKLVADEDRAARNKGPQQPGS